MKKTLTNLTNLIKKKIKWVDAKSLAMMLAKLDNFDVSYQELTSAMLSADSAIKPGFVDEIMDILEIEGVLIPVTFVEENACVYNVNLSAANHAMIK